jgi:hypothetical protein
MRSALRPVRSELWLEGPHYVHLTSNIHDIVKTDFAAEGIVENVVKNTCHVWLIGLGMGPN